MKCFALTYREALTLRVFQTGFVHNVSDTKSADYPVGPPRNSGYRRYVRDEGKLIAGVLIGVSNRALLAAESLVQEQFIRARIGSRDLRSGAAIKDRIKMIFVVEALHLGFRNVELESWSVAHGLCSPNPPSNC